MSVADDGSNSRHSLDTRIALLEAGQKRLEDRVNTVSERTHTLISSATAATLLQEEAQEQRSGLIKAVEEVRNMVHSQKNEAMKTTIELMHHVSLCDKRSSRIEKIGLAILAALLAGLGTTVVTAIK